MALSTGVYPRSAYRSMAGPCPQNQQKDGHHNLPHPSLPDRGLWCHDGHGHPVFTWSEKRAGPPTKYRSLRWGGLTHFVISVFPRGNEDDFTRAYVQGGFSIDKLKLAFQGMLGNTFGIGLFTDTSFGGVSPLGMAVSLLAVIATTAVFAPKKTIPNLAIGCSRLCHLQHLVFNGGVRQWGMLFVLFLILRLIQSHDHPLPDGNSLWSLPFVWLL